MRKVYFRILYSPGITSSIFASGNMCQNKWDIGYFKTLTERPIEIIVSNLSTMFETVFEGD